jgi:chemotaxis protein MotB
VTGNTGIDVGELQKKLTMALGKEIARQEIALRMTPEGFVISLHELGFFNSGEARLLPGAADKIKRIAAVLMEYGLDMRVEGHSDNVPIHNAEFSSNWALSTARASAVAMMLLNESRVDPRRLSIAGYGEYHPTAKNDTPEGRRANRRVDLVVVATTTPSDQRAQ